MNTQFFFRVNIAAVIAQLIVLEFSAGDLERLYPTSFFLFLGGKALINFNMNTRIIPHIITAV